MREVLSCVAGRYLISNSFCFVFYSPFAFLQCSSCVGGFRVIQLETTPYVPITNPDQPDPYGEVFFQFRYSLTICVTY